MTEGRRRDPLLTRPELTILIVDDHALFREGLSKTLEDEANFKVIGEAGDAAEAITLAFERNPDIILMDIDMPGLICFDAARRIMPLRPEVKIIFLSAYCHDHYIEEALSVKAKGYLMKDETASSLVDAINRVAKGELCFSEQIWARIAIGPKGVQLATPDHSRGASLTIREVEMLRYIAAGFSKKEIAAIVHISVKTVDAHTTNLMNKLNIHDRVELTRYAIREGIVLA